MGSFHGHVARGTPRRGGDPRAELRGLSEGPYPLPGRGERLRPEDQLELARAILLRPMPSTQLSKRQILAEDPEALTPDPLGPERSAGPDPSGLSLIEAPPIGLTDRWSAPSARDPAAARAVTGGAAQTLGRARPASPDRRARAGPCSRTATSRSPGRGSVGPSSGDERCSASSSVQSARHDRPGARRSCRPRRRGPRSRPRR